MLRWMIKLWLWCMKAHIFLRNKNESIVGKGRWNHRGQSLPLIICIIVWINQSYCLLISQSSPSSIGLSCRLGPPAILAMIICKTGEEKKKKKKKNSSAPTSLFEVCFFNGILHKNLNGKIEQLFYASLQSLQFTHDWILIVYNACNTITKQTILASRYGLIRTPMKI